MDQNHFLAGKLKLAIIMILAYLVASAILQWLCILHYRLLTPSKGFYDSQFKDVARVFRENFEKGFEREGAHLTVIQNGKVVVNIWNGYSDSESLREWTQSTRTVLFSTTKAIAALCLAMQIDRGRLSYDDLVVKYWPEYGQYGKHITTVEDILTHKAGIPYLENLTVADVTNEERIMKKLEEAKPLWKPGTATGYHAVTFGWLVDGIFRKVEEKGRSIKTFLQEEIADKYGIDATIGLANREFKNLARITQPGLLEYARDVLLDLRMIIMLAMMYAQPSNSIATKIRIHPFWLPLNFDTVALNDPNIIELNMAGITGVSNAYNLAKLFSLAIDGTLLSNQTLAQITQPTITNWHMERVFLYPVVKGHGFFFENHPFKMLWFNVTLQQSYLFGHPGYGCQALNIDIDKKLVIAYVSNGLKTASGEMCRTYQSILRSLYRSL
uniref:Beta-lactamase-related domain-containing protein n=1 Tax=Setaria digitata TaxID=48799 RepID=A0A915PKJ7_9BILA